MIFFASKMLEMARKMLKAARVYSKKRHLVLEKRAPGMHVLLVDDRRVAVFDCPAIAAEVWRQLSGSRQ